MPFPTRFSRTGGASIVVTASVSDLCTLLQTALRIVDALLFLINCEQTWYPFQTEFSHAQILMQNGGYTAF